MEVFALVVLAVSPGLALMAYLYLKDRYQPEPLSMVLRFFIAGILLVVPLMVIQRGFVLWLGEQPFLFAFGISALTEEFFKWFLVYQLIYRHPVFDEPYDGIVYASAVSLGYATVENVFYAFSYSNMLGSLLVRALLPVSGHALFGVFMGYYFGKAKFNPDRQKKYLWLALLLPWLWHGSFDYILLVSKSNWMWIMLPFMLVLWLRGTRKIRQANLNSPFRLFGLEEK